MSTDAHTPVEGIAPVLPEHRELIRLLADAGAQLIASAQILADIVHELRMARDPIGHSTRQTIGRFGLAIRDVGASIVGALAPELAK